MHLLERYALACGISPLKIGKPFIFKKYFPIPYDKYIVIHASSGMEAKNYDYYNSVLNMCIESIRSSGYGLVQIGGAEDSKINYCFHAQGQTDLNQVAYIINGASLLIGNDSFSTHMASAFGIPSVTTYSVCPPENCGPFWKSEKQYKIMSPLEEGHFPSYSSHEDPKTVNKIKPEEVVSKILLALPDLDSKKVLNIKSHYIGSKYHHSHEVNIIPNFPLSDDFKKDHIQKKRRPPIIRMDLLKEKEEKNLNFLLSCLFLPGNVIKTDSIFDIKSVVSKLHEAQKISCAFVLNSKNYKNVKDNIDFLKACKAAGAQGFFVLNPISQNLSDEIVKEIKILYLGSHISFEEQGSALNNTQIKDRLNEIFAKTDKSKTFFNSRKAYLSKDGIFASEAAFKDGIQTKSGPTPILKLKIEADSFLKEIEDIYIYEIINQLDIS